MPPAGSKRHLHICFAPSLTTRGPWRHSQRYSFDLGNVLVGKRNKRNERKNFCQKTKHVRFHRGFLWLDAIQLQGLSLVQVQLSHLTWHLMQAGPALSAWLPGGHASTAGASQLQLDSFQEALSASVQPRVLIFGDTFQDILKHVTEVTLI